MDHLKNYNISYFFIVKKSLFLLGISVENTDLFWVRRFLHIKKS